MPPRRLLLVRHAKAAHGQPDADRPLTGRGERQATALGAWLGDAGLVPDRVLVSPARRAAQTWERAAAALPAELRPTVEERIYDNTVEALLATVRETGRASGYADQVADFKELQRFFGMDEVLSLERRFLPGEQLARKYGDAA